MLGDLGNGALISACLVLCIQFLLPFWPHFPGNVLQTGLKTCAAFYAGLIIMAFSLLMVAFVTGDMHYAPVQHHVEAGQALLYRISAVWAHHEGSMVLWALMLGVYGMIWGLGQERRPQAYQVLAIVQGAIMVYMMALAPPFALADDPFRPGWGLNPLLQDPLVAIHPPILYAGYVIFAIPFVHVMSVLIHKQMPTQALLEMRPWILMGWSWLTLGITLGSFWAYYELGWGGWWFWDPVENASLLPWLLATGTLHGMQVVNKRQTLIPQTVALLLLTYIATILGTFIVRSGLLVSVHSFAFDPVRGQAILSFVGVISLGSLFFYLRVFQGSALNMRVAVLSREALLRANVYLFAGMTAIVAVGTLAPLALQEVSDQISSMAPPYFNRLMYPFTLVMLALMSLAHVLPWGELPLDRFKNWFRSWQVPALGGFVFAFYVFPLDRYDHFFLMAGVAGLCWALYKRKNHKFTAVFLGHLGVAVCILGMIWDTCFQREIVAALGIQESMVFQGNTFTLTGIERLRTPTHMIEKARVKVGRGEQVLATLEPAKQFHVRSQQLTTEVALYTRGVSQYYLVLGGMQPDGRRVLKIYDHPGVLLIWVGGIIMALAGFMAVVLQGKRYRRPAIPSP
jgi:cytochrome c-type biogenesis protein CcmF